MRRVYLGFFLKHRRYDPSGMSGNGGHRAPDRKNIITQLNTLLAGHFIENYTKNTNSMIICLNLWKHEVMENVNDNWMGTYMALTTIWLVNLCTDITKGNTRYFPGHIYTYGLYLNSGGLWVWHNGSYQFGFVRMAYLHFYYPIYLWYYSTIVLLLYPGTLYNPFPLDVILSLSNLYKIVKYYFTGPSIANPSYWVDWSEN